MPGYHNDTRMAYLCPYTINYWFVLYIKYTIERGVWTVNEVDNNKRSLSRPSIQPTPRWQQELKRVKRIKGWKDLVVAYYDE